MPLNIGNKGASTGMANAVYTAIDRELTSLARESLVAAQLSDAEIEDAIKKLDKSSWKRLSFAIADGVARYLLKTDPLDDAPIAVPEYAESYSSVQEDPTFWNWFGRFIQVLEEWVADPSANPAILHSDLKGLLNDPKYAIPTELKGIIK